MYLLPIEYLVYWFFAFNILALIVTMVDKNRARRGRYRVSERALLWVAGLGGATMMLFVMLLIRHKTRRKRFMIGLPLMIVGQGLLFWALVNWCPFVHVVF